MRKVKLIIHETYIYGNANWKDLLTDFNGYTITYDTIGNPIRYRDGFRFNWANSRQLYTVTNGANSYSYTYNADSLRTSKTVNGTTTNYYWSNGILQAQKTGSEYILFLYDESGRAYGFLLKNGTTEEKYYYIFNAQGDVIGIIDSNGTQVVNYTYGAWGDILSTTGTLASTIGEKNPLRYRGYYYDSETGFYYLQTRYYDPETGRFLNADGFISTGQGILSNNMFAYCGNNPVNNVDATGTRYEYTAGGFGGGGGSAQLIAQTFSEALIQSEIQKIVAALVGITLATPVVVNVMEYTTASLQQDMFYIRSRERAQAKEKTITAPKSPRKDPVHHIVAQYAKRAKPAQEVLEAVGINRFNDPANLVQLPAYYHYRIHSASYYEYVNEVIVTAYQTGGKENVYAALFVLKWEISSGAIW